jgi:hypothetical protein
MFTVIVREAYMKINIFILSLSCLVIGIAKYEE